MRDNVIMIVTENKVISNKNIYIYCDVTPFALVTRLTRSDRGQFGAFVLSRKGERAAEGGKACGLQRDSVFVIVCV